jgi:hypothetical protein
MTDTQNIDQHGPQILRPNERLRLARHKHLLIALEVDCRVPLVALAREVRAPVSTVFDDLKAIRHDHDFVILPKSDAAEALPAGWLAIMRRREKRHQLLLDALGKNARMSAAELSRTLGIPLSTIAEDLALIRKQYTFTIQQKTTASQSTRGEAATQRTAGEVHT